MFVDIYSVAIINVNLFRDIFFEKSFNQFVDHTIPFLPSLSLKQLFNRVGLYKALLNFLSNFDFWKIILQPIHSFITFRTKVIFSFCHQKTIGVCFVNQLIILFPAYICLWHTQKFIWCMSMFVTRNWKVWKKPISHCYVNIEYGTVTKIFTNLVHPKNFSHRDAE